MFEYQLSNGWKIQGDPASDKAVLITADGARHVRLARTWSVGWNVSLAQYVKNVCDRYKVEVASCRYGDYATIKGQ